MPFQAAFQAQMNWIIQRKKKKRCRLREEQLKVDKEDVQTGEVEIGKEVKTEKRDMDIPVRHDEIYVERRPVDENKTDSLLPSTIRKRLEFQSLRKSLK